MGRRTALDRLQDFICLLEHEWPQRCRGLFAVPRTAIRRPQPAHDLEKTFESGAGGFLHGVMLPLAPRRSEEVQRPKSESKYQVRPAAAETAGAPGTYLPTLHVDLCTCDSLPLAGQGAVDGRVFSPQDPVGRPGPAGLLH